MFACCILTSLRAEVLTNFSSSSKGNYTTGTLGNLFVIYDCLSLEVTVYTCIRKVINSNFDGDPGFVGRVLPDVFQSLKANVGEYLDRVLLSPSQFVSNPIIHRCVLSILKTHS